MKYILHDVILLNMLDNFSKTKTNSRNLLAIQTIT